MALTLTGMAWSTLSSAFMGMYSYASSTKQKDVKMMLNKRSFVEIAELFDNCIVCDKKYYELMEPVVRAAILKGRLQYPETAAKTHFDEMEKDLIAWPTTWALDPSRRLWAFLFVQTFPAFRMVNYVERTNLAANPPQSVQTLLASVTDPKKLRGQTASSTATGKDYAFTEVALSDDVRNSLILWELALLHDVTPESLIARRKQTDRLEPRRPGELDMPSDSDSDDTNEATDRRARSLEMEVIRHEVGKQYLKLAQAAMQASKSKRASIDIPISHKPIKGRAFLAEPSNSMYAVAASMSSSQHVLPRDGQEAFSKLEVARDAKNNPEGKFKPNGTREVKLLAVYWVPGKLKEETSVAKMFKIGRLATKESPMKAALVCLVAYEPTTPTNGTQAQMSNVRLFFIDETRRRKILSETVQHYYRASNGRAINKDTAKYMRRQQYGDDEESGEDASESDPSDGDASEEEEGFSGSDSEMQMQSASAFADHVITHRKPKLFDVDSTADIPATASTALQNAYNQPLLVEVAGLGKRKNFDYLRFGPAENDKTPKKFTRDGALQSFVQVLSNLYRCQMDPSKTSGGAPAGFSIIRYVTVMYLHGGHTLYREPTIDAEFDILITQGRIDSSTKLFHLKKEGRKPGKDVDNDVLNPGLFSSLDAPTLQQ